MVNLTFLFIGDIIRRIKFNEGEFLMEELRIIKGINDKKKELVAVGLTFALAATCLSGCDENYSNSDDEVTEKIEIEILEDGLWFTTGYQRYKKAYEHMICETVQFVPYENTELVIPEGYAYVSSETFTCCNGISYIKYNYINVVDVAVEEYMTLEWEKSYPFAGTPIELEKAKDAPKVLVR